ncbi:sn-glycerol-3-phosphate ABC transporter ATP-binding protein UgpC [Hahella sp. CR1]|uniref:ABC transporter ATP-binding protein n=1 Tax=Hahella sp. CR1 TaxID=2992807 RepID=UPI00244195F6|nr:sn-glycerol-3-phosphate ABC transporter ATP-binding protein UgpC [Hahella sp. CR1]MDG9666626.1 sn-glycerol-3-phosphate ABC transporter ATP-binding protein UgpC [Hahella sp. CR1]
MASLQLLGVEKSYKGGVSIIKKLDLFVEDGEFVVLVGPSGCGKSTLLRMIAGLEEVTAGHILIGDKRTEGLPPSERGVAMVFQSYALYPHMTVAENMGFSLKMAGLPKPQVAQAVERAAEVLQITHLLQRKPKALSGGQRQRVAIGRAIVRQPSIFLFDEPLSNLDAALRAQMRLELAKLHKQLGTTMVYVTHDQTEAMTLGDRIVVLNGGHIEQTGRPMELYERPGNQFVAGFIGSPKMNFLPCRVQASSERGATVQIGSSPRPLQIPAPSGRVAGEPVCLGVRPEHVRLTTPDQGIPARVDIIEEMGDVAVAYLHVAGLERHLVVKTPSSAMGFYEGGQVGVAAELECCHLFNQQGVNLSLG